MKSISKILIAITILLSFTACNAQIKNTKTEIVKIYGNCGMCKERIEKAGNIKKIAKVDWNVDTKMATITYDSKKTNQDAILKRIALAGHDSDKFLASNQAYSKLPNCCQYDREAKVPVKVNAVSGESIPANPKMDMTNQPTTTENQLKAIFDNYFAVKDALVKTDGNTASAKAKELLSAINAVKMETLKMDEHMTWMKVFKDLIADAKSISETQDIEKQRNVFNSLSKGVYELIKVSKPTETVYYQYCPMKKMNWLSKENTIKNPYFGSQMLSCGSVVETIK